MTFQPIQDVLPDGRRFDKDWARRIMARIRSARCAHEDQPRKGAQGAGACAMNDLFGVEQREQLERMGGVVFLFVYVASFLLAAYWLHHWIRL